MYETLKFHDYLEILFKRKWSLIIPFVVITMMTMGYLRWAPKIYEASTLILVESQQLPTAYVQPTVTESMENRLRTIVQQIKSRSFIEKIIEEFKLNEKLGESHLITGKGFIEKIVGKFKLQIRSEKNPSLDSLIESLREHIFIHVTGAQAFSISFQDRDPVMAMNIANRLTALFIERNLKEREERAEGTILFLNKELSRVKRLLKLQEKQVSDFRTRHLGELPEQLESNLRTLDRLQDQLIVAKGGLTRAQQNRRLLQQQLQQQIALQQLIQQQTTRGLQVTLAPQARDLSEAEAMESEDLKVLYPLLRRLRLKYTDEHPQIIKLKAKIAQLESSQRKENVGTKETKEAKAERRSEDSTSIVPSVIELKTQIGRTESETAQLSDELVQLQNLIKEYQRRVEITPKVEQQLNEITRGYEVTQKEYQSLLDKKLQAELAASMEKKQKGQRFKILDMAKIPEKPVKPKSLIVMLVGILLASAGGVGLAVIREQRDTSFYKIKDLEDFTEFPVIARIPKIKKKWRN